MRIFTFFLLAGALLLGLPRLVTELYAQPQIYPPEAPPGAPVAIVFGAGLQKDGSPSPVLRDRVTTAAGLYFSGKIQKLLMSGDNRFVDYNEPAAMKELAVRLGVPEENIVLDYAGRRTYDTCYRARHIFGVEKALVVTQRYHLPRALYTCNLLGIESAGVSADREHFTPRNFWLARELVATTVAMWELWVARPLPVLGNPEPIFQ